MAKAKIISIFLVLSLAFGLIAVYAEGDAEEFSEQGMYDWLIAQSIDGAFENGDIESTAWGALALSKANFVGDAESSLNWLEANKNENNCWPQQGCSTVPTSLAVLAYREGAKDTAKFENYFKSALRGNAGSGKWLLEVTTSETGACKLSYTINDQLEEKEVSVEAGKFPECGGTNFFDLNSCLRTNLLENNPNLVIDIDCCDFESAPFITLVYKSGNSFYIVTSEESNVISLTVPNGCFGRGTGDACNTQATLYAAWALAEMGSEIDTSVYLRENYDENDALHNSFLYFISKDVKYLEKLKKLQSTDGALDRNAVNTALAVKAWEDSPTAYEVEIGKATSYLKSRQRDDGSINSEVKDTAAAIYGAFGYGASSAPTCTDGLKNQDERGIDCGGVCQELYGYDCCDNGILDDGEDAVDCGGYCDPCDGAGTTPTTNPCVVNSKCEVDYGETAENCEDCFCGDGECDSTEDSVSCPDDCQEDVVPEPVAPSEPVCGDAICEGDEEDTCPQDCEVGEESSAFATVLIIIIILVLLGGGGFFAYKKGWITLPFGGGAAPAQPQRPKYKPFSSRLPGNRTQPVPPARPQPAKPSSGMDKLSKSLEEAKKLLKK